MTPEKRSPQPAAGHARAPFRAQGTCAGTRADCCARPRAPRTGPRGSWASEPGLPALFWLCDWFNPRPGPYEVRCGRSLSFSAPPGSRCAPRDKSLNVSDHKIRELGEKVGLSKPPNGVVSLSPPSVKGALSDESY